MKDIAPRNFKFCEISLFLAYKSLLEIDNIINHKSEDASPISKTDTFRFYLFTLHYAFILEMTKLLEKHDNSRTNHFASLDRLNRKICNIHGKKYTEKFKENEDLLNAIWNSEIFIKILELRNSKVAHIDNKSKIKPFVFVNFSENEIKEIFKIIEKIKKILDNCLSPYFGEFILPNFSRTSNLLTYFEEYRGFAHSKPIEFWKWKNENYL